MAVEDRPHLTVAAVVEREGRYLVVEENERGRIVFNQPAGHVEAGETLVEAVVRETLEETAWHFEPRYLIGLYRYYSPWNEVTYLRLCFAGRVVGHEPERPLDRGIVQALWMSRDELLANEPRLRSPMVLRCIDDYVDGRRYPLDLLTEVVWPEDGEGS